MDNSFNSKPSEIVYTSQLNNILINASDESIRFKILDGDNVLISEVYYASNHKVMIYDVASLLESYMRNENVSLNAFYFEIWSENDVPCDHFQVIVLYCDRRIIGNVSASEFLYNNFLTTLNYRRIPENACFDVQLYADCGESLQKKVKYSVVDDAGVMYNNEYVFGKNVVSMTKGIISICINVNDLLIDIASQIDKNVLSLSMLTFSLSVGSRMLTFWIDKNLSVNDNFFFRNCFNAIDFCFLDSITTDKTVVERSQAVVNGKCRFYDQSVSKSFEVKTSCLTFHESKWLDQLISAFTVYKVIYDGSNFEDAQNYEIMITDSSCEVSNSNDKPNEFKFSWKFSDNRPLQSIENSIGIFSDEFSPEFN